MLSIDIDCGHILGIQGRVLDPGIAINKLFTWAAVAAHKNSHIFECRCLLDIGLNRHDTKVGRGNNSSGPLSRVNLLSHILPNQGPGQLVNDITQRLVPMRHDIRGTVKIYAQKCLQSSAE